MATLQFMRLDSFPIFVPSMLLLEFLTINGDGLTCALFGMGGALFGQIRYFTKRGGRFNLTDFFSMVGWVLIGGFFPLVLSLPGVPTYIGPLATPIIAVLWSPFIVYLFDVAEKHLPLILQNILIRFEKRKEINQAIARIEAEAKIELENQKQEKEQEKKKDD